jgi:hypothetical protein
MGSPDGSFVANRQLVAALRAAAGQHGAAIFRFHTGPESMFLRALAIIRLKCTFRHDLFSKRTTRLAEAHFQVKFKTFSV